MSILDRKIDSFFKPGTGETGGEEPRYSVRSNSKANAITTSDAFDDMLGNSATRDAVAAAIALKMPNDVYVKCEMNVAPVYGLKHVMRVGIFSLASMTRHLFYVDLDTCDVYNSKREWVCALASLPRVLVSNEISTLTTDDDVVFVPTQEES